MTWSAALLVGGAGLAGVFLLCLIQRQSWRTTPPRPRKFERQEAANQARRAARKLEREWRGSLAARAVIQAGAVRRMDP